MSTKQFISAEEHLAKLGVTVQQAQDFIIANVGLPEVIFAEAFNGGVTNSMLSEITNISTDIIGNYFTNANLDKNGLDQTSLLINSDLGAFESLVDFNNNSDILSTASLANDVQPLLIDPSLYDFVFGPVYVFQTSDGIYDSEELGVSHLGNVDATNESIESLFYGSLLNIFSAIDETELSQINAFSEDGNPDDLQALLIDSLSDTSTPTAWTNEELKNHVTQEAVNIMNEYLVTDVIGVLDLSFLGLAVA